MASKPVRRVVVSAAYATFGRVPIREVVLIGTKKRL